MSARLHKVHEVFTTSFRICFVAGDKADFLHLPAHRHVRIAIDEDNQIDSSRDRGLLARSVASATSSSRRSSALFASSACSVANPPECPVFQAFRRVSASLPRTSPTEIRSGLRRMHALRHSSMEQFAEDNRDTESPPCS